MGDALFGDLLDLENILSNLQKAGRVDGIAVDTDLEVQVCAGGAAGGTHVGDGVSAQNRRTSAHAKAREVSIAGKDAMAVVDLHHIAIALPPADIDDPSRSGGEDGLTIVARKSTPAWKAACPLNGSRL